MRLERFGLPIVFALILAGCSAAPKAEFEARALSPGASSPGSSAQGLPASTPAPRAVGGLLPPASAKPSPGAQAGAGNREPSVLKLGTVLPLQGGQRPWGEPLLRTTQAYIDELNARGGVGGYKLRLIAYNACLVCEDEALQAVKRLVEQDQVFAIVNTYVEVVSFQPVIAYLVRKGVPLIQGAAENQKSDALSPVNFVTAPPGLFWARLLAEMVARYFHVQRVGLTYLQVPTETNGLPFLRREFARKGIQIVDEEPVEAAEDTVTNMDAIVTRMRSRGAQAVATTNPVLLVFGRLAAARQGWNVQWAGLAAWSELVTEGCGRTCDDLVLTESAGLSFVDRNTPQMRQYRDTIRRRYPGGHFTGHSLASWVGMQLFTEVFGRSGPDRRAFIRTLESIRNLELGTTAPLRFSPDRHMGATATTLLRLKNGSYVAASGPVDYGEARA